MGKGLQMRGTHAPVIEVGDVVRTIDGQDRRVTAIGESAVLARKRYAAEHAVYRNTIVAVVKRERIRRPSAR